MCCLYNMNKTFSPDIYIMNILSHSLLVLSFWLMYIFNLCTSYHVGLWGRFYQHDANFDLVPNADAWGPNWIWLDNSHAIPVSQSERPLALTEKEDSRRLLLYLQKNNEIFPECLVLVLHILYLLNSVIKMCLLFCKL